MTAVPPLLPNTTRNLLLAALGLLLFMDGSVLAAAGFRSAGIGGDDPEHALARMLGGLCGGALVLVLALFLPPSGGLSLRAGLMRTAVQTLLFFIAWGAVVVLLYPPLLEFLGLELKPQPVLAWLASGGHPLMTLIPALALICVVGPIAEEILFRGYLLRALHGRLVPAHAVLLTSLLFGLMHGLLYAFPTALLGIWFGLLAVRSGGLAQPVLAHVLHNTLVVGITLAFPQTMDWIYHR